MFAAPLLKSGPAPRGGGASDSLAPSAISQFSRWSIAQRYRVDGDYPQTVTLYGRRVVIIASLLVREFSASVTLVVYPTLSLSHSERNGLDRYP